MAGIPTQNPKQTSINATGTTTVVNAGAFDSTLTAGNALIAALWYTRSAGSTSVTLSGASNPTWTLIASQSFNGTDFMELYIAPNIPGGVTTQLTCTFGNAVDFPTLWVCEFSGLVTSIANAIGVNNIQNTPGTGSNAVVTSNTGALSATPGMLFGITFNIAGDSTPSAGTGFTSMSAAWDYGGIASLGARPEYRSISSASTATWTAGTNQQHTSLGVYWPEATSGTYTLVAASGSFALNGQAANLLRNTILIAAQGSFAFTGQAAVLTSSGAGRTLIADVGLFTLIGSNALVDTAMNAEFGTFALNGQTATLTYQAINAYNLTAAFGSFALNGQTANLLRNTTLIAASGSYGLTGYSAGLIWSGAPAAGVRPRYLGVSSFRFGV